MQGVLYVIDFQQFISGCVLNPSQKKQASQLSEKPVHVLRTGIELYMIINVLTCLQAVLQAVENFLIFYASPKGIMIKHNCAMPGTIPRSIIESLKRHTHLPQKLYHNRSAYIVKTKDIYLS